MEKMKQYFDLFFKFLDFVYETNSQVAFYKKAFMQYMDINNMEFIPENDLDFLVAMAERIFPFLITLKLTESSEYYDDEAMFKLYSEVWEKTASDMDSVDEYGGSYFTASDKAAQQHFLKFVETNDEIKDIFSGTSKDIELILRPQEIKPLAELKNGFSGTTVGFKSRFDAAATTTTNKLCVFELKERSEPSTRFPDAIAEIDKIDYLKEMASRGARCYFVCFWKDKKVTFSEIKKDSNFKKSDKKIKAWNPGKNMYEYKYRYYIPLSDAKKFEDKSQEYYLKK